MRVNLVVSNCTELWVKDAEKYQFLTQNCRDHAVSIGVSPAKCLAVTSTKQEAEHTIKFIDRHLSNLLPILASRLAKHHGQTDTFWRRSLFFYLRDLIGSAHSIFEQIEPIFDPTIHEVRIASLPDKVPLYGVSASLEDGMYWAITDEGREYYAGEYFRLFYPGLFIELPLKRRSFLPPQLENRTRSIVGFFKGFAKTLLKLGSPLIRVMVTNAQYEKSLAKRVFLRSFGQVSLYQTVPSLKSLFDESHAVDSVFRAEIAKTLRSSENRFEQYLGRCIETSLPWALAEGFDRSFAFYRDFWTGFPRLQFVISENMYQQDALPLAVCESQGIEPITLPHFFPLEISAASILNRLQIQDRFLARGAFQKSAAAIGSGTVYPYTLADTFKRKDIDTLYVTTDFYAYFQPLQHSADGCGYDVFGHFKLFINAFTGALSNSEMQRFSLKKRPPPLLTSLQMDYPDAMRVLDPTKSAKAYMPRSKLVIVEGMSTALLESLASNIPTIAFWPSDLYHFADEFDGYFSVLEDVGIVVHDPDRLAFQVKLAQQDPRAWWFNPVMQDARARFMDQNLHSNAQAEKVLLGMARNRHSNP